MNNKDLIIGGEKVFSPAFFLLKKKNDIFNEYSKFTRYFINYTFGGFNSLLAIIDDLYINKEKEIVLLPSYLCDSIIKPFDFNCIKYIFYKIDKNLLPDILHIKELISTNVVKAILFIDYMGKSQINYITSLQMLLRDKRIKIIQDCVQTIKMEEEQFYGDYIFNSFRKITPFEGSIILSKKRMKINFVKGKNFKFLFHKRIGQFIRYAHLKYNFFKPEMFLKHFELAEKAYYIPKIYKFSSFNKKLIRRIDFNILSVRQKKNYKILIDTFEKVVLDRFKKNDFFPFGFFILINDRNRIRTILSQNKIYCPIHWVLPDQIQKDLFFESYKISLQALTIPIYGIKENELNHLIKNLNNLISL